MDTHPERRLVLMRHAIARPPTENDYDRALAPEGPAQARASGRWLHKQGIMPEMILCSSAVRTRQSCLWVREELGDKAPTPILEMGLYRAGPSELLSLIAAAPDSVETLLVIGHMPALFDVLLQITSPLSEQAHCERASSGFPPAALAVFSLCEPWSTVGDRGALLKNFEIVEKSFQ